MIINGERKKMERTLRLKMKDKEYVLQYFNVRDGEQEYDRRFMYDKAKHIKLNEVGLL